MGRVKNEFHDEIVARASMEEIADMDQEATAFAMELLMPEEFLRRDLVREKIDICDDRAIEKLAQRYKVPKSVMAIRIGQLTLKA